MAKVIEFSVKILIESDLSDVEIKNLTKKHIKKLVNDISNESEVKLLSPHEDSVKTNKAN